MNSPDFAAFAACYAQGRGQLLWDRRVSDLETPVAAFLKLAHGRPYSFLLESIEGGASRGRYSIVGFAPDLIWRCAGGTAALNRAADQDADAFVAEDRPALDSLRALLVETRLEVPEDLPPMCGGLVGYLGYDMVRLMERLPAQNPDLLDLPDALLVRPTLFAIFDNVTDLMTLAAPVYPSPGRDAAVAWEQTQARLQAAFSALAAALPAPRSEGATAALPEPTSNFSRDGFLAAVERGRTTFVPATCFR